MSANVKPETFGHLFSYSVDGAVFGQPLVVSGVSIPNAGRHDVVYVTTANNSVYAFDAQDGNGAPLWQKSLTRLPNGGAATVIGIYSTPVIDRAGHTIFVVAGLMEGTRARYVLHALDLSDGTRRTRVPWSSMVQCKWIRLLVPFEPTNTRLAVQRAALAIAQGKIIIAFGGDFFEGWVFSYDKADLRDLSVGVLHDMREPRHGHFRRRISESGLHLPRARRGYLASGARPGCRRRRHGLFLHRQQGAHRQERLHDPAEQQSLRNVLQRGWLSCARASVRPKCAEVPIPASRMRREITSCSM